MEKNLEQEKDIVKNDVIAQLEEEIACALNAEDVSKETEAKSITAEENDLVSQAEALGKYADLPEDKELVAKDDEANEVLAECDAVEAKIASMTRPGKSLVAKRRLAEKEELDKDIAACEKMIAKAEEVKTSSVSDKNGIEEEIGNEAAGEDPSVSTITKSDADCEKLSDVAGGNCEFVAKSITKRLDRCAEVCEKRGLTKLAFAIDKMSDEIEKTFNKN